MLHHQQPSCPASTERSTSAAEPGQPSWGRFLPAELGVRGELSQKLRWGPWEGVAQSWKSRESAATVFLQQLLRRR